MNKPVLVALAAALLLSGCVDTPPPDPPVDPPVDPPGWSETVVERFVAVDGADSGSCDDAAAPCRSINYAVTQAADYDIIRVGPGAYVELVSVTKPLLFFGANAGVNASTEAGERGPESVVKGFRSPGAPHPSAEYEFHTMIDGFTIDPLGDPAMLAPDSFHSVSLFGAQGNNEVVGYIGGTVVSNNIFRGGDYEPGCSFTCTSMMDSAVAVFSGTYNIAENRFENYRRPIDVVQPYADKPVTNAIINGNVVADFTFRAIWAAESPAGGAFAERSIFILFNTFAARSDQQPRAEAAVLMTAGGAVVGGNTIANTAAGIYEEACGPHNPNDLANDYMGNTFTNVRTGYHLRLVGDCVGRTPDANFTRNTFAAGLVDDAYQPIAIGVSSATAATMTLQAPCNYFGSSEGPGAGTNPRVNSRVNATPWALTVETQC